MDRKINSENIDSYLFLNYIKSHGFKEEKYSKILELFQPPRKSISQFLDKDQFLLVTSIINCDEFREINIKGACGYLNKDRIEIPKTLKNDAIYFRNKTISLNNKLPYVIPKKEEFSCIVGNGISKDIGKIGYYDMDQFIGYCIDKTNKKRETLLVSYKNLFMKLREIDNNYEFIQDTIKETNKELCLIKKV